MSTKLSVPEKGGTLITGLIMLENGRIIDSQKPRTVTFDGHFWVPGKAGGPPEELIVIIQCFMAKGSLLSEIWPEGGLCFIHAMVTLHLSLTITFSLIFFLLI